jgi:hypothetical protein
VTQEHLAIAKDWAYRPLSDAGGALYHPYGGDVHAVTELPAQILNHLAGGPLTREACVAATVLSFPDEVEAELREAVHLHLESLIELGAVSRLGAGAASR